MKYILSLSISFIILIVSTACTKNADMVTFISKADTIDSKVSYKGTIDSIQSSTDGTTTIKFNADKTISITGNIIVSGKSENWRQGVWDSKDNKFIVTFIVQKDDNFYLFHLNGIINQNKIEGAVTIQYRDAIPTKGIFSLSKTGNP